MGKKRITVSLTEEQYELLQDVSGNLGGSMSQAVSWIMSQWEAMVNSNLPDSHVIYQDVLGKLIAIIDENQKRSEEYLDAYDARVKTENEYGKGFYMGRFDESHRINGKLIEIAWPLR